MDKKIIILPKVNNCKGDLNKKWFIYYSYRNPKSGKMQRFKIYASLHEHKTKKARLLAAEELLNHYTEKLKSGYAPFAERDEGCIYEDQIAYSHITKMYGKARKSNYTFSYYASEFLKQMSSYRKKSIDTYTSKLRLFNLFLTMKGMADNDISAISNATVIEFFQYLTEKRDTASITYQKYKNILYRLFDFAIANGKLKVNPVQRIPVNNNVKDMAPRPINPADIEKLKTEIQKDRQLWLAVQLEYYCFLRPDSEILNARIKWFDLANSQIRIPADFQKTKRSKIVIIPDQLREMLLDEWKLPKWNREDYLISHSGTPGPTRPGVNYLRRKFNDIRDKLDLPKEYKMYSWKHTGNVAAENAGMPTIDRMHQNGHTSIGTTEKYTRNKMGFVSERIKNDFPTL